MFIMFGVLLNLTCLNSLRLLIFLKYVKSTLSRLQRETAIQRKFKIISLVF